MRRKRSLTPASDLEEELPAENSAPVDQVIGWLIEGHRDGDIREAIAQLWPGKDPKALQLAAVEHFARAAGCDLNIVHGWALEAYRDLYRRMVKIGDFANAMRAVKELVNLSKHVCQLRAEAEEDEQLDGEAAEGK